LGTSWLGSIHWLGRLSWVKVQLIVVFKVTSCYSTGSRRPHRCRHLANNVEYILVRLTRLSTTLDMPKCVPKEPFTVGGFEPPPSNRRFIGRVHTLNSTSIDSSVFVRLTFVSSRQTHPFTRGPRTRGPRNIGDNRPHLMLCTANRR